MEIHITENILFDSQLHREIQTLAKEQERDFAGQVKHMLRQQLEENKQPVYSKFVIPGIRKKA